MILVLDVQPPIHTGCPKDIFMNIANPTVDVNWTVPSFHDPMNTELRISSNYPTNHWTFHWGDFIVQYVATKLLNGLRSECLFNIKIRRKCAFSFIILNLNYRFNVH